MMESVSLNKKVYSTFVQIRTAIQQLKEWNENVYAPDNYYDSPEGMENFAASCMLIETIGEGIKKINRITQSELLVKHPEILRENVIEIRNHNRVN